MAMKHLENRLKTALDLAIDTLLPPRCVVSGQLVDRQGMLSPEVWKRLDFLGNPFCAHCGMPFEFEVENGSLCASCLERRPVYDSARAALRYNDASREIILGFKHGDKTHAVLAFIPWLKKAGAEILPQADFLIPVPLHPWRLLARRYNQAGLIAQALGRETDIPVLVKALRRIRSTPSQGHLKAKERSKNVRRAFAVHPQHQNILKDKNIVLIDDVHTTGSTVEECAKTLKQAGAKTVHVLTLARVVGAYNP